LNLVDGLSTCHTYRIKPKKADYALMYKVAWMSLPSYWSADVRHNVMPPDVWAAFLLHHAEGGSGNCRNQAISLKTPSMSEIAMFRHLTCLGGEGGQLLRRYIQLWSPRYL